MFSAFKRASFPVLFPLILGMFVPPCSSSSASLHLLLVSLLFFCCSSTSLGFRSYDGFRLFRATPLSASQISALHNLSLRSPFADDGGLQFWQLRPQLGAATEIFVEPAKVLMVEQFLRSNRIPHRTLVRDFGIQMMRDAEVRSGGGGGGQGQDEPEEELDSVDQFDLGRFHSFDSIHRHLQLVARRHREFASLDSLGQSFEGRPLPVLTLGYPAANKSIEKPALLVDAGIHAREWIAPAVALHFVNALINQSRYHSLLRHIDVHVIPVANPDGYVYSWTKDRLWRGTRSGPHPINAQLCPGSVGKVCYGTDPNRNFPYHWDESGTSRCPCSQVYSGEHPLSEPECAHLARFLRDKHSSLKAYLTLHAYGNLIIHTWNFRPKTYPDEVEELRRVANSMANAIAEAGGDRYQVGSAPDILYSAAGGSDDYAQSVGIKYVYTMELTSGNEPAGSSSSFGGFLFPEGAINDEAAKVLPGMRVLAEKVRQIADEEEKKRREG